MSTYLEEIRYLYSLSSKDSRAVQKLKAKLKKRTEEDMSDHIFQAYQAAVNALEANYMWNPLLKLGMVQKAASEFKQAIELQRQEVETRFLRFTIEVNTPFFLGLSPHLKEDQELIIENIEQESLGDDFRKAIGDYLLEKGQLDSNQKEKIKKLIH